MSGRHATLRIALTPRQLDTLAAQIAARVQAICPAEGSILLFRLPEQGVTEESWRKLHQALAPRLPARCYAIGMTCDIELQALSDGDLARVGLRRIAEGEAS